MVGHRPNPQPATLFVESSGTIVANRAREPSGMDLPFAKASFGIGHQNSRYAGTSRVGGHIKLIQLGTLQKVKAEKCPSCFRYTHTRRGSSKSFVKALQCPQAAKFHRDDSRMSVLPAVEPDLCQVADLR
jgi:hypothetical protein